MAAFARALAMFYAGLVVGVSFIATIAKFRVAELTTAELLLVGRETFGVFGWIELGVVIVLAAAAWYRRLAFGLAIALLVMVAVQVFALQPGLVERINMMYAGEQPPPSPWHTVYAVLEVAKVGMLLWMSQIRPKASTSSA